MPKYLFLIIYATNSDSLNTVLTVTKTKVIKNIAILIGRMYLMRCIYIIYCSLDCLLKYSCHCLL